LIVAAKADLAVPGTIEALRELYAGRGGQTLGESGTGQSNALRSGNGLEVIGVSARTREGLDDWFKRLWELLAMIRVYSKEPGRPPDMHKPFVVRAGATVADLALQIHRDLPERMKFARLWGHSRFEGQQVHKTEPLRDKDVVEIHE
jgi:ribosome-interacting GTPase 1